MQDSKPDTFPLPGLTGNTALRLQLGYRRQRARRRQGFADGGDAARMVLVAMRHDQYIELLDALRTQIGNDDALTSIRFGAVQWLSLIHI